MTHLSDDEPLTAEPDRQTMPARVHQLHVDYSDRPSALLDAVQRSGTFHVRMVRLANGDYLIDNEVLIERKTMAD